MKRFLWLSALVTVLAAGPVLAQAVAPRPEEGTSAPAPKSAEPGTFGAQPVATTAVAADPGAPPAPAPGLQIRSTQDMQAWLDHGLARWAFGPFDIALHSRVQMMGGWVGKDSLLSEGDKMQHPGFRLRRVRVGLEGHLYTTVSYLVELDIVDSEQSGGPLHEAWVDWTPCHWFGVTAGFQKFLLVRTMMDSSAQLAHVDRALGATAMSPEESLGVSIHSEPWKDHLTLSFGVFNAGERVSGFFQGWQPAGVTLGNRFENLAYSGRVDLVPLGPIGRGEPDLWKEHSFRLALGGGGYYNDGGSTTSKGWSAYVAMKAWGFHLLAEGIMDWASPKAAALTTNTINSKTRRAVAHATVGYMILRDLLGIAARVEWLNDNLALTSNQDETLVYAGTLSYYAIGHFLKAQVEYQHRQELHGAGLKNDSALVGLQAYF